MHTVLRLTFQHTYFFFFFFQAEDGIRDFCLSRGLGDVYKRQDKYRPEHITLYQLTGGFLGMTVLLPLFHVLFRDTWSAPTAMDWLWLIVLSWVCTILTFFLYIRSLKNISAFTMNLTLTLEPIYGIILAFIIYHENRFLSQWFYLGFALIVLAVLFHTWRLVYLNRRKPRQH